MHVLFEEDGAFKAGTVLADNTTSLQVETGSGKRVKVKAANVLLRFAAPAPGWNAQRWVRLRVMLETLRIRFRDAATRTAIAPNHARGRYSSS